MARGRGGVAQREGRGDQGEECTRWNPSVGDVEAGDDGPLVRWMGKGW